MSKRVFVGSLSIKALQLVAEVTVMQVPPGDSVEFVYKCSVIGDQELMGVVSRLKEIVMERTSDIVHQD